MAGIGVHDGSEYARASYGFVDATAVRMFFFFMGGVPFSWLLPGLPTVSNSPKGDTAFSFYTPIGTTSPLPRQTKRNQCVDTGRTV